MEQTFSDLKIKQTQLCNQVQLSKLEKMSKVGALLRSDRHSQTDTSHVHRKRKNHANDKVASLLHIPCYADILNLSGDTPQVVEDTENLDTACHNIFITSSKSWRMDLAKWVGDEQAQELWSDMDDEEVELASARRRHGGVAMTLAKLFGGNTSRPVTRQPQTTHTKESLLMELMEAEYDGEAPDDGALEGSGDDFDGWHIRV